MTEDLRQALVQNLVDQLRELDRRRAELVALVQRLQQSPAPTGPPE